MRQSYSKPKVGRLGTFLRHGVFTRAQKLTGSQRNALRWTKIEKNRKETQKPRLKIRSEYSALLWITKSHHCPDPVFHTYVNFAISAFTLISKQPVPSLPPSFILSSIIAKFCNFSASCVAYNTCSIFGHRGNSITQETSQDNLRLHTTELAYDKIKDQELSSSWDGRPWPQ